MSSRVATSGTTAQSRSSVSNSQRRHRSRSTSRYADLEKPKKKKTLSATTSLVSIPNTIKLSMLNSGLLSFEKVKLEARDENNSLSQTIPDKPIELHHFVKLCDQRRKFPVLYKLEFQTAVKVDGSTCRHATRKNNHEKNQNQKCIPYDYNRVVLEKTPGVADSDYINASYIDSLLKPNAYIVTQGPTEETVNDFWKMVWQENVSAIVMLTKTFDFTKVMCVQYWPPNMEVHETYGDININIVKEEQLANFQIRTFRLYKKNAEQAIVEERFILQFHYTEWHSHTCPFSNAVLEFRRRVRAVVGNIIKPNSIQGPMLVHCNDGGGRSGVYLAIDANLELAEEEDCFHVFGYLKKIRQSRRGLIENVDQYKFVYDTLEEHVVCGKTWFPVSELSERLKAKAKKDSVTKMNEYQKEYAQICKQTPRFTIGDCAGGHRADNREKNRDVLCVPPDNFRPYLTSFQGNAFTDYINSVFVDGYTKPREYVVTEWPMKHTLGEFWSLVYDHECSAIVILCQPPQNSQQYPPFWPQKSKSEKYGPVFSVDLVSSKHFQNIKQWEFKINKKIISLTEMMAGVKAPTKTVQLFQLTCWPLGHKVPTSTNSLVFLMNMVEMWRQRNDYGPVCVVSPDGRSRSGVYCAANACIEQVIQHGEVDVFQAIKTVRRHRPQLIENMTEYKYCYDLVLHYVLHFLDKDLKAKKFIAFGRGKSIPLTPDSTNNELPGEISNTGRIVVNKCIDKIDKHETILEAERDLLLSHRSFHSQFLEKNGQLLERRKKGRLYSLGGNEPQRKGHRGRLDRLKTVGTFDLGTEMSVLSQVARNLNEQIVTGDMKRPCMNKVITKSILTPVSINSSLRNTPELKKREIERPINFKGHSADDCIANSSPVVLKNAQKSRSLSTSSYARERLSTDTDAEEKCLEKKLFNSNRVTENSIASSVDGDIDSRKFENSVIHSGKHDYSKDFSYRSRKSMLRKSKRIVRTDSEIFKEGIIDRNEYTLRENEDIQIHANHSTNERAETRNLCRIENGQNVTSISSNLVSSRKNSSEIDIFSPKDRQKSTDESSKNVSNDDMDAVFSESITELERIEQEYKELLKSNLQREYKSDGDALDEVGKKRSEFGKWKNQSLEHEFEYSNSELLNIIGDQTLSIHSYCTSSDTKDVSRICSPESCATGAYSDSGVKFLAEKNSIYAKMRSRVYSSSRLGETPTERERLQPMRQKGPSDFTGVMAVSATSSTIDNINIDTSSREKPIIRPSNLEIKCQPRPKTAHDNPIQSLFEKPFGKLKRVNKLLKSKRFSTPTLYDKKKPQAPDEIKNSSKFFNRFTCKENQKSGGLTETKSAINLSKLSLFSQKTGKTSILRRRKLGMFSAASHSNSELSTTKTDAKNKLSEVSKSHTELRKYRTSPMKSSKKKGSRYEKNNIGLSANICHSPLSEEFYNKTGSVRLSAVELYEKFCSDDFTGLYKDENRCNDQRFDMHEYRLEQKGLRVIGRYNKNARLLKQRSEPRFILHNTHNDSYYHEEDEYFYNVRGHREYGYYNEQDEYYNEYAHEDMEGDYYEDDEEGDYYDDVDPDDPDLAVENSPLFIDTDLQSEFEFQLQHCGAACVELKRRSSKPLEAASTGTDSEIDEIYLMPSESKCGDDDEFGFENKHFSLEHSMLRRSVEKDHTDYESDLEKPDDKSDSNSFTNIHDEILTIYRLYSRENISKIIPTEPQGAINMEAKKQRSTSYPSQSLENAVKEYIKYATSDLPIEPTIIKTDCISIDRTDSLELLSNSSGTIRSRSTLTEFALDTVRNMNLDSCSTSKLSLSLKSEVFDDFTLTPDDLKTIQNCEVEDFTLTPDGSLGDSTTEIANNTKAVDCDMDQSGKSAIEDDCPSGVLVIVDKFLENERNNFHRQSFVDTHEIGKNRNPQHKPRGEILETSFDETMVDTSNPKIELKESCKEHAILGNVETLPKLSDSIHPSDNTENKSTLPDRHLTEQPDDHNVTTSLFTSELTKELDRLFSQSNVADTKLLGVEVETTQLDNIFSDRPNIPSRYSMQKLVPYDISENIEKQVKSATGEDISSGAQPTKKSESNKSNCNSSSNCNRKMLASSCLKKVRSQSLGNLSKKTKCFPL